MKTLEEIYYDASNPGSFGGARKLYLQARQYGYTQRAVTEWLSTQKTYNLHRPIRVNFSRQRVLVGGIDVQHQADLSDLQKYAKENDGFRYVLFVIDVVSKFLWVQPLKTKSAKDVTAAFQRIYIKRIPKKLQTDDGTEFFNKDMRALLRRLKIHHFSTKNAETKASIVERVQRSFKSLMFRLFTKKGDHRYINDLQKLCKSINQRYHRSIKMAPANVTKANERQVLRTLYADTPTQAKQKFIVGDYVKVSKYAMIFRKGYEQSYTIETFRIKKVMDTVPRRYVIEDLLESEIKGTFYDAEMVKITKEVVFDVEKVIRRRGNRALVRWLGYDNRFDSWVDWPIE